jgi:quinol-cytochrome oxidoreductase complex cytochrome b subunit
VRILERIFWGLLATAFIVGIIVLAIWGGPQP